ncbi:hypothetical protein OUZ56_033617 [Daphnia magna]|uniref:Uncharacterized protein n=1 Tax=Daphnia magna TaxID=35525 RepID=A0ABQ9ZYA7_9CRUS|nr:hypothetical protein OUZ56_033617 [Daphnia magna]
MTHLRQELKQKSCPVISEKKKGKEVKEEYRRRNRRRIRDCYACIPCMDNWLASLSRGNNANSDTVLAKGLPYGKCVYGRSANSGPIF